MRSWLLLILVLLGGLTTNLFARADAPTLAAIKTAAEPSMTRYDFGNIASPGAASLTHTFLLRNDSSHVLTIIRFVPSCHCTTAVLVPDNPLPQTLAPGAQTMVRVSITVEPYLTGSLEKSVAVFASSQDAPVTTLTLDATLHPLVALVPEQLNFGVVPAGHARTLLFSATMPKGQASDAVPELLSSDPDLRVMPVSISPGSAPGTRKVSYQITLSAKAVLGPVQALLQFASTPASKLSADLTLADSPGIPVSGTVQGLVTANLNQLAFGIVPQGRAATLRVILKARHAHTLSSAEVSVQSPNITARWFSQTALSRALNITLSQATPPGTVHSEVMITLADGERLRFPVMAYVTAR